MLVSPVRLYYPQERNSIFFRNDGTQITVLRRLKQKADSKRSHRTSLKYTVHNVNMIFRKADTPTILECLNTEAVCSFETSLSAYQNMRSHSAGDHIMNLYLSMALYPCGPWPLFRFLILYTVGRTHWMGDKPITRPLPTQNNTHTE
jgi:hypothetical protein